MGVTAGIGWRKAALLKNENQRLDVEMRDLQQQLTTSSEEQKQKQEAESRKAAADSQELTKLRGEVSRLRTATNETERLRDEVSALKTQIATRSSQVPVQGSPAEATPATDHFARDSWMFSGYATPESALVSAIWAMKEGKPQAFLDSLSPEEQQRMMQTWQGKSEGEIGAKHQNDVANIQGVRILSRSPISATEIQMQVFLEGVNRVETFKMNQAADQQWKFGGFVRK